MRGCVPSRAVPALLPPPKLRSSPPFTAPTLEGAASSEARVTVTARLDSVAWRGVPALRSNECQGCHARPRGSSPPPRVASVYSSTSASPPSRANSRMLFCPCSRAGAPFECTTLLPPPPPLSPKPKTSSSAKATTPAQVAVAVVASTSALRMRAALSAESAPTLMDNWQSRSVAPRYTVSCAPASNTRRRPGAPGGRAPSVSLLMACACARVCASALAPNNEGREAGGAEARRGGGRSDFTRVRPSKALRAHPAIGGAALLRRGRRGARCAHVLWRRRDERLCSRWPMQSISGRTHINCTISVKTKCKVIYRRRSAQ